MADDVNPTPLHERKDGRQGRRNKRLTPAGTDAAHNKHAVPPLVHIEPPPCRPGRYDITRPTNARESAALAMRVGVWVCLALLIILVLVSWSGGWFSAAGWYSFFRGIVS